MFLNKVTQHLLKYGCTYLPAAVALSMNFILELDFLIINLYVFQKFHAILYLIVAQKSSI